jgi:hypothetical protein
VFEELVARQDGVVSLAQAAAHGYSVGRVQRRVREGRWRRLHPGVVLVGGHRLTEEGRIRAAWLWAGERSVVAGPAAAAWHGMLARRLTVVDVTVPAALNRRPCGGVRFRRRDLPVDDVTTLRGVRVTGPGLTALEAAVAMPDGSAFLDRALQRHVPFDEVYRAFCRSVGCWNSAGDLLVAAADRADSAAERTAVRLLRAAGIGGWELGHPFGPWQIDLAFPQAKVAVEIDGWAWHVDQDRFANDRRKATRSCGRAGWCCGSPGTT